MTPTTVSFTVRRPTPVSRPSSSGPESDGPFKIPALPRHLASAGSSTTGSPLAGSPRTREDSDDDEETGIVFATRSGADTNTPLTDSSDEEHLFADDKRRSGQRGTSSHQNAPLVIPTQPNPDWREAARRRRAACTRIQRAKPSFLPQSALATTGADGSMGGLGTRDTINSGPQRSGLQFETGDKLQDAEAADAVMVEAHPTDQSTAEETEDQRALRAILAGDNDAVEMMPIPPLSEADALKQDVRELPDVATADDYDRVPISAFGAAMLRGMGWTDGAVASKSDRRRKNGLTKLYLPQSRPALLGIGAKEREPDDDGSGKKKPTGRDMRYVPIARKESGRGEDGSRRSSTVSRRSSRSPSRQERGDRSRRKEQDRDRDRGEESRRRTKDYDDGLRARRRDKDRDERDFSTDR